MSSMCRPNAAKQKLKTLSQMSMPNFATKCRIWNLIVKFFRRLENARRALQRLQ